MFGEHIYIWSMNGMAWMPQIIRPTGTIVFLGSCNMQEQYIVLFGVFANVLSTKKLRKAKRISPCSPTSYSLLGGQANVEIRNPWLQPCFLPHRLRRPFWDRSKIKGWTKQTHWGLWHSHKYLEAKTKTNSHPQNHPQKPQKTWERSSFRILGWRTNRLANKSPNPPYFSKDLLHIF